MLLPITSALMIGTVMLTVLRGPGRTKAIRKSEEAAHAAISERRSKALETRREARYVSDQCGIASVLGEPGRQAPCRIINASRSGLRIACDRLFPKGTQLCVQWGHEFFVGSVLYTFPDKAQHVAGLELLSGNHQWHPLGRLCNWRWLVRSRI